jgi:hypothetical protein
MQTRLKESEVITVDKVIKVDEPKHQGIDEIAKAFWDNWLLISNVTDNPKGGVVRHYCRVRDGSLTSIIMDMDQDYDTYGECVIRYVGPGRSSWVGRMGT